MQAAEPQRQTPTRRQQHPFDSLAYAKSMESVGFTRQQAEKMAEEQAKLIDERLATKEDIDLINANIEALRVSNKADIEALRLSTKTELAETKADLIKWVLGIAFAQTGLLLGVLKLHG